SGQAIRARAAERDALAAAEAEREAKRDAEQQREQAQRRLAQIERGNAVLVSIFDDLDVRRTKAAAEPLEAALARRLVKAGGQLDGEAVGDPLAVAGLQNRLGYTLLSLGVRAGGRRAAGEGPRRAGGRPGGRPPRHPQEHERPGRGLHERRPVRQG